MVLEPKNWILKNDCLTWILLPDFQAFSGTSMSSRTPERDLRERRLLTLIKMLILSHWENGGSWQSLRWSHEARRSLRKLSWKFCWDQTSWTLSRLTISFKSLSGVLKHIKVSKKAGYCVRGLGEPLRSFTKNSSKLDNRIHVKWWILEKILPLGYFFKALRAPKWIFGGSKSNPWRKIVYSKKSQLHPSPEWTFFWDILYIKCILR